jgi:hypothetical protein
MANGFRCFQSGCENPFWQRTFLSDKRITFVGNVPTLGIPGGGNPKAPGRRTIFLLSPANASGARSQMLRNPEAQFELALRLRGPGAALGEIFSFISGLYFRGKLAYALRFADPPPGVAGVHIITASGGLLSPHELVTLPRLQAISAGRVDAENPEYREPLVRDMHKLHSSLAADAHVVLLGSIATPKYVEPLLEVLGHSLLFPRDFVGRGDMSRGGLLLRSTAAGVPLAYVPVLNATRSGARPGRLQPGKRTSSKRSSKT